MRSRGYSHGSHWGVGEGGLVAPQRWKLGVKVAVLPCISHLRCYRASGSKILKVLSFPQSTACRSNAFSLSFFFFSYHSKKQNVQGRIYTYLSLVHKLRHMQVYEARKNGVLVFTDK